MDNLYNRIISLCEQKGISGYRLCKDIGIQPSILTDLKMGRQNGLSAQNAEKVASYFGVSVGYLLGTDTKKAPTNEGERDDELTELLDMLRTRPECRMLFSLAKGATKEDIERAVAIIEALREKEGR